MLLASVTLCESLLVKTVAWNIILNKNHINECSFRCQKLYMLPMWEGLHSQNLVEFPPKERMWKKTRPILSVLQFRMQTEPQFKTPH